jgi:hypothetical protein
MRENLTVGYIIELISQSKVGSRSICKASTSMDKQRIPILNIAIIITAALASLTFISITKKAINKNTNAMFMFLFLLIGIGLFSLSVSMIMTNAQASSGSTTSGVNSSSSNETGVTQMGICVIGVVSPCNGDSNLDTQR